MQSQFNMKKLTSSRSNSSRSKSCIEVTALEVLSVEVTAIEVTVEVETVVGGVDTHDLGSCSSSITFFVIL